MTVDLMKDRVDRRQLRLFLEEICSDLCPFQHVAEDGLAPEQVRVDRVIDIGVPGLFADIRVQVPKQKPYFLEIKTGYPPDVLLDRLPPKYGVGVIPTADAERLILLIRSDDYSDWPDIESKLRSQIRPDLELTVWDEPYFLQLIRDRFEVEIDTLTSKDLLAVRRTIEKAKWRYTYDDEFHDHHLADTLMWHFGFWTLRRLYKEEDLEPHQVLAPGLYRSVAILMADLCSFSSYVRDTRDEELIRHALTTFYSRARHAIHGAGGMLYQFVGDEVVGLFGFPDQHPDFARNAVDCARSLVDIGNSVSYRWQRELDRVQESSGVHIGIAMGELNLMPLRPYSENYIGFVGDSMNMAARLTAAAAPSEIVVSNSFRQRLGRDGAKPFQEMPSVEGKNVGLIRCWKLAPNIDRWVSEGV